MTSSLHVDTESEQSVSVFEGRARSLLAETTEVFSYGDAAYVIATVWRKPPRMYCNLSNARCECGQQLLKVGTHCALCHVSFVEDAALELHLTRNCEPPVLADGYVLTEWGGYRLKRELEEGKAWMLNGEIVDAELLPWVADYVQPIPEAVETHN